MPDVLLRAYRSSIVWLSRQSGRASTDQECGKLTYFPPPATRSQRVYWTASATSESLTVLSLNLALLVLQLVLPSQASTLFANS